MRPESFGAFAERTIANYAHENVASFRWEEATATARAREQFAKLLPDGIATPGHYLCDILNRPAGEKVGELWFEVAQARDACFAYLWDLYIDAAARRELHAKTALLALEAKCRELGATALALQVFAHNAVAQALYTSLGFSVTGFNMIKRFDEP